MIKVCTIQVGAMLTHLADKLDEMSGSAVQVYAEALVTSVSKVKNVLNSSGVSTIQCLQTHMLHYRESSLLYKSILNCKVLYAVILPE
jgi:hypothetical protein